MIISNTQSNFPQHAAFGIVIDSSSDGGAGGRDLEYVQIGVEIVL